MSQNVNVWEMGDGSLVCKGWEKGDRVGGKWPVGLFFLSV